MPKVIAIGGLSRSGKSTLALWLHQQLRNSVMLSQDDFPNEVSLIPKIKERVDWEHPESIHWENWQRAVQSQMDDCKYLILEGLFIFRPEASVIPASFSYYLTLDKEVFIKARAKETRWGPEPSWYLEHVWESHNQFGLPYPHQTVSTYHQPTTNQYADILTQIKG